MFLGVGGVVVFRSSSSIDALVSSPLLLGLTVPKSVHFQVAPSLVWYINYSYIVRRHELSCFVFSLLFTKPAIVL